MNEPLITIVVPVHKVPKDMLHKCLNSIVAQTSNNYEALLVDDGSPDDCGDICDTYAKEYSNFRVLHQENGGLSVARNTGIRNARGEWVCFGMNITTCLMLDIEIIFLEMKQRVHWFSRVIKKKNS